MEDDIKLQFGKIYFVLLDSYDLGDCFLYIEERDVFPKFLVVYLGQREKITNVKVKKLSGCPLDLNDVLHLANILGCFLEQGLKLLVIGLFLDQVD